MAPQKQNDKIILEQHGLSISQIEAQLHRLRRGMPSLHLARPCRVGDGIIQLSPQQNAEYCKHFRVAQDEGRISKFIPASGAATRMFKDLLQFIEMEPASQTTQSIDSALPEGIATAWEQLFQFPFRDALQRNFAAAGIDLQKLYQTRQITRVFQTLLHVPGLGYAHLPKALLPFHRYPDGTRTSLEEHVHEAMMYPPKTTSHIRIHLTVSAQFETQVRRHIDTIKQKLANSGFELELTVSIQKPSTDTVALDSQGEPFRDEQARLIFRPGGHGALLENLNDYQGDIVCISNIDNVVPDHLKREIVEWRMALAGYLLTLQDEIFHHLRQLELAQPTAVEKAQACIQQHLHQQFPFSYDQLDIAGKVDWLKRFLHRPIRVCGVVPNTGDPGGGPFWVQHADGSQSRQIVEQSQGDPESESQQQLFALATHFNPVDMVCGVRDYRGCPFNLLTFSDPDTSFISHKTYQGRPLKALEWPGLWNGSMADWLTIFVEVPRSTFNPVKTFLDWLQPNHQPPV